MVTGLGLHMPTGGHFLFVMGAPWAVHRYIDEKFLSSIHIHLKIEKHF